MRKIVDSQLEHALYWLGIERRDVRKARILHRKGLINAIELKNAETALSHAEERLQYVRGVRRYHALLFWAV